MNRKVWKKTAVSCLAMLMVSGMIPLRPIAELAESIAITASAEDSKRGTCGENVYWVLDEDNTLTISGKGAMADYKFDTVKTPWFAWREQITGVVIGKGVTHIGETAFYKCSNLSEIMIPDSVQSIGQYAFHKCNSLLKVKIPDGVTTIEEGTFYDCKSLTEITIPDSVTSFGKDVFEKCKALTSIVIPEGVTTIPNSFLAGCSSLPSISIPDGVTSIGDYAFAGCELVETLKIPENVTSIGRYAFASDYNLASVNIPDGVTSIEDGVFFKCQSLQHINIPDGVTKIGAEAFYYCNQLTEITIPDGVISIGQSALSLCTGLTEITLPDSVISIDVCSFENCVNLRTLKLSKNLTSIAFGSIGGCDKLTEIIIPESVTSIEGYSFNRCSGLTEIRIPENVTSIGENAFDRCSGVTAFTIPKNVTSIGSCAFIDCTSLQKLRILNPDCEINDNASTIPEQTFICGYSGSTAKAYAEKYGRSFIELTRITTQPEDFLGDIGETAEFTVEATGENLTYRWQFLSNTGWKDSGMEGANTPQLRVPVTAARDGQQYRCIVVSNIMTIASDPASIKVKAAAITSQPTMQTLPIGQTAKFTVAATGSNLTYQWQFKDGMTWKNSGMTGANTATLSVPVTAARDGQQYRCIVSSNGKMLTSDTASIKVKTIITSQPTNQTGKIDSTIKFTVAASGTNLKYQWQFLSTSGWKNSGMTGANTAALSVPVTTERDGQQYRCVITSANGTSATTNAVKLIVGVKITIQPKDYTGNVGTDAKFTVEALGRNFGYQWQFNDNGVWKNSGMNGAKTNTLSVPITAARNGQKYRCVVKSTNGTSEVSSAATLKAISNNITGQPQNASGKVGDTVKFTVTAANATYQWQFLSTSGWKNSGMTGAQTATISVPVIEARDGQKYRCVVKFADGWTKTSNEVSLKVQTAITTQPQNQSGKVGTTAKFTVAASGTNLTYQWQFLSTSGWQNSGMTGAKTATISVPITDARNGQQYRCIVISGNGTNATSNAAKLIVR